MRYPKIPVIGLAQNLGYCVAYNLAIPSAIADGCEWVIWADNDIGIEEGSVGIIMNPGGKTFTDN